MKPHTPPRRRGTEKRKPAWRRVVHACSALLFSLCLCGPGLAAPGSPDLPGRLFYTPAERAQLEQARARLATPQAPAARTEPPAPLRYDGVVIRSDGRSTYWIDGRAQPRPPEAAGLKPGQTRADGKIFEPYQVLRPVPAAPDGRPRDATEPAP